MGNGLLSKYRVLDVADELGIFCGRFLGDFGAEVIKVERPEGDVARSKSPFYKDIPSPEHSLFWYYTNLHKKGITLNINTETGKQLFKQLVKKSDIVIESFQPGYLDDLGLGYKELSKVNPGIILTSITPFGQEGPYSGYKASDLTLMALGGMLRLHTDIDRPPTRFSVPLANILGGLHGATGTMVALYYRELTGEGQWVDVSCQEAIVLSLMEAAEFWDLNKVNRTIKGPYNITRRPGLPDLVTPRVWECKDGYVSLGLVGGVLKSLAKGSNAMIKFANRYGMALDIKDYDFANYDTSTISVEENSKIMSSISEFVKTRTKAELFAEAVAEGILCFPITTVEDIIESPQFKERNFWIQVEHAELGDVITYPGLPQKMSNVEYRVQRRAPRLGEHNTEIYEGELGLSAGDMVLLKSQQII